MIRASALGMKMRGCGRADASHETARRQQDAPCHVRRALARHAKDHAPRPRQVFLRVSPTSLVLVLYSSPPTASPVFTLCPCARFLVGVSSQILIELSNGCTGHSLQAGTSCHVAAERRTRLTHETY